MIDIERRALAALKFNLAPTPDDVWRPSPYHVAELHKEVVESVFDGVNLARSSDDSSPLGVVIQGPAGAGKTHMLGMVRQRTQNDGGYFFLVSLLNGKTFWESTALCIVDGLLRESVGWPTQLKAFLRRLSGVLQLGPGLRDAIAGDAPLQPSDLDALVTALRGTNRTLGQEVQDTLRALVLHGSDNLGTQDIGYAYLNSLDLTDYPERTAWGLTAAVRSPQQIVRDMSRLLALTGSPTVIAYDQLDTLFSQSTASVHRAADDRDADEVSVLGQVADGLMALREVTRRTLIVVSCLPDTWAILKRDAAGPVPDRFREGPMINRVSNAKIGLAIVRKRLEMRYAEVGFTPPYPTWPIKELAFTESSFFTPRRLLKRVEQHATQCLRANRIVELAHLEDEVAPMVAAATGAEGLDADFQTLDQRFDRLVREAHVDDALEHAHEDRVMPALLSAGLKALIEELDDKAYKHDPPPSAKPALHARLRQTLDETLEDEIHWGFRAIASSHPSAVLSRLRAASTMSGLDSAVAKRKLFVLRNTAWPTGPTTSATVQAFHEAGGHTLPIAPKDLKVFDALRVLQAEEHEHLAEWLASRTPASRTELFQAVLGSVTTGAGGPSPDAGVVTMAPVEADGEAHPYAVRIGVGIEHGRPFDLDLETLRDHAVVFAGSGSGRTVLLRRLVEECALKGVSAIVLDAHGDFAGLGDAWPQAPSGWGRADAGRARDYLHDTDVVVWTPRIETGRPLAFAPLPAFAEIRDRPDELRAAVDVTVGALAPRAKVDGSTARAEQGQAVLRDALTFYARHGQDEGLRTFLGVLHDLPDGVTEIGKGQRIARDMADTLTAAMVNDPLFAAAGPVVGAGQLLTPPPGKRARVSVISLAGLPTDDDRQSFVTQLQLALFGWISRNPAGDRPLAGLLVIDEAQTIAPASGGAAATLALAIQARAYGLGLVFATPAPRGLHPQLSTEAGTHIFGLLNSPVQIAAAKELAEIRGGSVPDISLLAVGEFYAAADGQPATKIRTPLCLSHHPGGALTTDDIISRAARSPAGR